MGDLKKELRELLERAQQLELDVGGAVSVVPGKVASMTIPYAVDCGFLFRELSSIFEELRKKCNTRKDLIGQALALKYGAGAVRGENIPLNGELATGAVNIDNEPRIPNHTTPEFIALMQWLGVPPGVAAQGAIRPSFRRLTDEINRRVSNGEKLPPGIEATYAKMTVTFRKKLNINAQNQEETQDVSKEE